MIDQLNTDTLPVVVTKMRVGALSDRFEISFQRVITYRLTRLHAKLNASATRALSDTPGLTLSRWRILLILNALGTGTLTDIARSSQLDKGQLSRDIKKMVDEGLLESETDMGDMRQHRLTVSEEGRKLHAAAKPAMDRRQESLRSALTEDERETLFQVIDKLEAVISETEADQETT